MDRLTIEEVENQMQNFYGAERKLMGNICQKLADTMRENERLRDVLNYVAVGEDKTVDQLIAEYDKYQEITNKESDDVG